LSTVEVGRDGDRNPAEKGKGVRLNESRELEERRTNVSRRFEAGPSMQTIMTHEREEGHKEFRRV
jgi:hypothetical protein